MTKVVMIIESRREGKGDLRSQWWRRKDCTVVDWTSTLQAPHCPAGEDYENHYHDDARGLATILSKQSQLSSEVL